MPQCRATTRLAAPPDGRQDAPGRLRCSILCLLAVLSTAGADVDPPPRALTLDIHDHGFAELNVYHPTALNLADPELGTSPVRTVPQPTMVELDVPDHVTIVEMVP